jgi:hypothetical protein
VPTLSLGVALIWTSRQRFVVVQTRSTFCIFRGLDDRERLAGFYLLPRPGFHVSEAIVLRPHEVGAVMLPIGRRRNSSPKRASTRAIAAGAIGLRLDAAAPSAQIAIDGATTKTNRMFMPLLMRGRTGGSAGSVRQSGIEWHSQARKRIG